jgi:hypothetical protein
LSAAALRDTASLAATVNESAIDSVQQRKYQPAPKNGQPVAIHFSITVDFRLR